MLIRFGGGWILDERTKCKLNSAQQKYNRENPDIARNVADFIAKKTGSKQVFMSTYFNPYHESYIGISNRADDQFDALLAGMDVYSPLSKIKVHKFEADESMAFDLSRKQDKGENALNTFTAWCHKERQKYKGKGQTGDPSSDPNANLTISNTELVL